MNENLPVMLLKGLVLLPSQEVRLELNNDISKLVLSLAMDMHQGELIVVCPKDQMEEAPEATDLPTIGVVGKIKSRIELPNGNIRVVITGLYRVKINDYFNAKDESDVLEANVSELVLPKFDPVEEEAVLRKLKSILKEYIDLSPYLSNSVLNPIRKMDDLNALTDLISTFLPFPVEKKLEYMQEINALHRAKALIHDINIEVEVLHLDAKIEAQLQNELEANQKEFILKEKIHQIQKELGEENIKGKEVDSYLELLASLPIPDRSKEKIRNEIMKYDHMPEMSPDASVVHSYLDWVLSLPWGEETKDVTDLAAIRASLDRSHYGLEEIKDRIVEYIAVKMRNPELKSPILCFVGPPGVGKTSLAMGIARALKKEFYKISVGGLNDSAELVGHRRTYLGANPGKIIQGIRKCHTKNPVFLIDEVDKMVHDFKGDPASALLDILDPEQNTMFTDNYIEEPFDLSKVLFILTANDARDIPSALQDRLEMIYLSTYSLYEKLDIAKKYLLPHIYADHKTSAKEIKFTDDVLLAIIRQYTFEAGVRSLERTLEKIVRKIVTQATISNTPIKMSVRKRDLKEYLGPVVYDTFTRGKNRIGVVNGLAYTPLGGMMMPIEACMFDGKGAPHVTGNLERVMKESLNIAASYIRANQETFQVSDYIFTNKEIHVHCLDGAVPKDGPSAGVAFVTVLLSLVRHQEIPSDVGMTGEITLHGDVLKIGGVKEKITGGFNAGLRKFFLPKDNMADLEKIPKVVLDQITVIPVQNYMEIYEELFMK